ncbi:MAG: HNH endonuclease [Phycisphaerae bacterium]
MHTKPAHPRSPQWPAHRQQWLQLHNRCTNCGRQQHLEVHHTLPVHLFPQFELDFDNYVTLCEGATECHLRVGHLGNWQSYNAALVSAVMWTKVHQLTPPPLPATVTPSPSSSSKV